MLNQEGGKGVGENYFNRSFPISKLTSVNKAKGKSFIIHDWSLLHRGIMSYVPLFYCYIFCHLVLNNDSYQTSSWVMSEKLSWYIWYHSLFLFNVFLLLDWLPYQGLRFQSAHLFNPSSRWTTDGFMSQVLTMQVIVDLVVMPMKRYSTFQKAFELKCHNQM